MSQKPVAFMSYFRSDDQDGYLTKFREKLATETRMNIEEGFDIVQDTKDIRWGEDWQQRIKTLVQQATFFIPIITPGFFTSRYCLYELQQFLDREEELNRNDLILPVYYMDTPQIDNIEKYATDELAQVIAGRNHDDWRNLRLEPFTSRRVRGKLKVMAQHIRNLWYEVSLAQDERLDETVSQEMAQHVRNLWYEVSFSRDEELDEIVSQEDGANPSVSYRRPSKERHNLPALRASFVGRKRELLEVKRALAMTRLLTLTGVGGSGKTRLALEAARDLVASYPDGIWFVELASLSEAKLVAKAIAAPVGVVERAERPLEEGIEEYLRQKKILLVLDNFEQVLKGSQIVARLLSTCPGLKVLATSRVPLGLYGEKEYLVPPLSLPDPERLPALERLTQYEAVRLFIERAQDVRPDFSVTNENAPTVAEICARLDGLPLAIELAVARIKVLSPQKMLDRLDDRLKLLGRGARDLPERQRTLRATMEWSHALLDEGERVLFGRLSVFAGGRTLEAIEAVCDAEGDLPVDVLDGVESLVDKSLLREEEGPGEEPRFVMLETVHEYAREKLEENGEAEELRRLHAQYFLSLAEEEPGTFEGGGRPEWFQLLEEEHDNFRAALSWSLESDEVEFRLRLAVALQPFWIRLGYYNEGRRWLEVALTKDDRVPAALMAKGQNALGWLAQWQGDIKRASVAAKAGLELSPQVGKESSVAMRLQLLLGYTAEEWADYERANELFEEILELSRKAGDGWVTAATLLHLGNVADAQDESERAIELYEEGLALCRNSGYEVLLADILVNLGYTHLLQRDLDRATALSKEAIALYRKQGYRYARIEVPVDNLGWAAFLRGDEEDAKVLYQESLMLCRELGDKLGAAESLEGLACVAEKVGETERSALLFGAANSLFRALNKPRLPGDRALALREPYLSAAQSRSNKAAWEEGSKLTFEEAVEYALS